MGAVIFYSISSPQLFLPTYKRAHVHIYTHKHARTPAGKLRPPRLATYWLLRATWKMFVLHRYVVETQLIFVLVRRHSSGEGWGGGRQWERGWEVEQTVQKGGMCVGGRVGWGEERGVGQACQVRCQRRQKEVKEAARARWSMMTPRFVWRIVFPLELFGEWSFGFDSNHLLLINYFKCSLANWDLLSGIRFAYR